MPKVKPVPDWDAHGDAAPGLRRGGRCHRFLQEGVQRRGRGSIARPSGKAHARDDRIEGSAVMLVDEMPEYGALGPKSLKGSPVTIHLYVGDADAFVQRAVDAGAKITMPLADMFWGDRYGQIEDPFGHHWSVATHVRDLSPEEIQQAMQKMGETK